MTTRLVIADGSVLHSILPDSPIIGGSGCAMVRLTCIPIPGRIRRSPDTFVVEDLGDLRQTKHQSDEIKTTYFASNLFTAIEVIRNRGIHRLQEKRLPSTLHVQKPVFRDREVLFHANVP